MMKKETMRFYIAIVLSVIAILTSLTAISMGISVIFSDASVGNDVLPGGELFAFAFVYLTEMLASIFAASASALAAFFTFFVQKQMKNGKKTAFFTLFCVLSVLTALDILVAVVMSF